MTIWVLTIEYNDYDQHGEYFIAVFSDRPTLDVLKKSLEKYHKEKGYYHGGLPSYVNTDYLEHILKGGGRMEYEDEWYFLREVLPVDTQR